MPLITTSNTLRRRSRKKGWVLNLKNLRSRMNQLNYTDNRLAKLVKVTLPTVQGWFRKGHQPLMGTYLRVCEVLRVQP